MYLSFEKYFSAPTLLTFRLVVPLNANIAMQILLNISEMQILLFQKKQKVELRNDRGLNPGHSITEVQTFWLSLNNEHPYITIKRKINK